jgi:hypothetical protein
MEIIRALEIVRAPAQTLAIAAFGCHSQSPEEPDCYWVLDPGWRLFIPDTVMIKKFHEIRNYVKSLDGTEGYIRSGARAAD